ncbi:MAG: hypothetical protein CMJ89_17720 [Planctomycetes bacterium]|jgi:nitrite reductase/ring-hydroxylating ferredoxin subunit|nr:hypothetical protein [Planctomycetota bacterium]
MAKKTTEAAWQIALPLEKLAPGTMRTIKRDGCQLALGCTSEGEVFALDNRCPHEGYPLAQGTLKGRAVTCVWHNWKFDVGDGRCTLGGEGVRTYPVRVHAGQVEVDLTEPDPREFFGAWKDSFDQGLYHHDNGRALRDGVRLLQGGYDPYILLADIAVYDALHAEYGTTHTLPVAADCARFLERRPGVDAMYAIAPAIDICGDSNRRLAVRELPAPIPYAGETTADALRAAVEAEEVELSQALLLGAFDAAVDRATIEGWLYAVLSDHFLNFGHQLIYMTKAQELLDRVPDRYARDIYAGLLYRIVLGTREDTLPYMSGYARRLGEIEDELPQAYRRRNDSAGFDPETVRDAVLDASTEEAFESVWRAIRDGVDPTTIAKALVGAAGRRFYRFDTRLDSDPLVAENWVWISHRLTFSSAVRNATLRFDSPDVLRLLFQAVMFLHSARAMDLEAGERTAVVARPSKPQEILAAIARRDCESAVAGTAALVDDEAGLSELQRGVEELCLAAPLVLPIVVAHAIKTSVAAFEETAALAGHPDRAWPLLATVRFLASPIVERRVHEAVGTSIRWVAEGIMPRKLSQ